MLKERLPMQKGNRIQIEIPASLRAVYSNFALIIHTASEFFVDFAQILPGIPKTQVHTRVVMSPTHAKLLYKALGENLEQYEAKHGAIEVPPTLADQLFGGLKPPEVSQGNGETTNE
ncbi:MAG: DUF3467 domain-containing protein [Anaerolineae bacterium]|jgi:hypothetical protein|nr:DUF3467 domain-containing protein [Anaerolineae bacterium]